MREDKLRRSTMGSKQEMHKIMIKCAHVVCVYINGVKLAIRNTNASKRMGWGAKVDKKSFLVWASATDTSLLFAGAAQSFAFERGSELPFNWDEEQWRLTPLHWKTNMGTLREVDMSSSAVLTALSLGTIEGNFLHLVTNVGYIPFARLSSSFAVSTCPLAWRSHSESGGAFLC